VTGLLTEDDFRPLGDWSRPGSMTGASVIVEDRHGRLLMQLRDDRPDVPAGGLWAFFGGGIEPGEGYEAAAIRELAEETGLVFAPGELRPFVRVVTVERNRTRLYVFRVRRQIDPAGIRLAEGAGFAFLTRAQAERYPTVEPVPAVIAAHFAEGWG
jgi:8-oxo-dGTP pyrophosphatase MutT (NUDIX family)